MCVGGAWLGLLQRAFFLEAWRPFLKLGVVSSLGISLIVEVQGSSCWLGSEAVAEPLEFYHWRLQGRLVCSWRARAWWL